MKTTAMTSRPFSTVKADYREPSYLRRLAWMFYGLRQPRQSLANKEAVIELQRLSAPVSALLIPLLAVVLLSLMSSQTRSLDRQFDTFILQPDDTPPVLQDPVLIKPEEPNLSTEIDNTIVSPDVTIHANEPEALERVSRTPPVTFDAVQSIKSIALFPSLPGTSRGAGVRGENIAIGGGSQQTEDAVVRALRWLKKNQQPDGSWNKNKVAMTSLAVLTFLAHDETPGNSAEFGATVQRAIEYLLSVQNKTTGRLPGNYDHPIATYALCEAYAMTRNPNLEVAAKLALAPLLKGQHPTGGWTYNLDSNIDKETGTYRDDTSYMGWCVQALKAAQMADLKIDGLEKACKLAVKGFKKNASPNGGFGYTSPGAGGLTGVGTLCLQLLGAGDEREVKKSMAVMDSWSPSFEAKGPMGNSLQYYFYYATQCKFHAGGKRWKNWNREMKPVYVAAQQIEKNAVKDPEGRACDIGWWANGDTHTDRPVMDTCLASLQLMVYYRYLLTTHVAAVNVEPELKAAATEAGDIPVEIPLNL
jgi:hypothetical protein